MTIHMSSGARLLVALFTSCAALAARAEPADDLALLALLRGAPAEAVPAALSARVTPEMLLLQARGGGGPDAACHYGATCPSPTSCNNWSSWVACDTACCADAICTGGRGKYQPRERFRTCFMANGSQCTEYQVDIQFIRCGCGLEPEC